MLPPDQELWGLMVLLMGRGRLQQGLRSAAVALASRRHERLAFAANDLAYPPVATDRLGRRSVVEIPGTLADGNQPMLVDNLPRHLLRDKGPGCREASAAEPFSSATRWGIWGQTNSRLCFGHKAWRPDQCSYRDDAFRHTAGRHFATGVVGARTDLALLADLGPSIKRRR
jgi:hypothetical protein